MTLQEPVLSDPPKRDTMYRRGRGADPAHGKAARLAQDHPGKWVKVGDFKSSQASQIRHGKHGSYPGPSGTWEATVRISESNPDLQTLWVRLSIES